MTIGRRSLLIALTLTLALAGCGDGTEPATEVGEEGIEPPTTAAEDSDEPVRLAVIRVDTEALGAVFGADEAPDAFQVDDALIEHINDNGGIAGRQIEPQFLAVGVAEDQNAEGQRVCEEITQDSPVDIAITHGFGNEVLLECLGQREVAVLDANQWTPDSEYVEQFPNWFPLLAMSVDRSMAAAIEAAVEQGALGEGDTLGVLYEDCQWASRVFDNVIEPLASEHGFATERASVKCIENLVADLGPVTERTHGSILRFQGSDVTHVIAMTAAQGFVTAQLMAAAAGQNWTPSYLITSNAFPFNNTAIPDANVQFQPEATERTTGAGHVPLLDLGDEAEPANDEQAARQAECEEADPGLGLAAESDDDGRWQMVAEFYGACDLYFALRDLLEANGVQFSVADVTSGYDTVLDEGVSATLVDGRFGGSDAGRTGSAHVRPLEFDAGAGRFAYAGPATSVTLP
jgi:hypothetical protein